MQDPVARLPSNVVICIFRKLPLDCLGRLMLVSKLWFYSIDGWSVLWSTVDRSTWLNARTDPSPKSLHWAIVQSGDALSMNMLSNWEGMGRLPYKRPLKDSELWAIVRRAGPALKKLVLELELSISEAGLRALLWYGCANIRYLNLRANGCIQTSITNEIIAMNGRHLTTVVLVAVGVDNSVVRQLLLNAPNLKYLDLSHCMDLTCEAFPPADEMADNSLPLASDANKIANVVWDSNSLELITRPNKPQAPIVLPKLESLLLCQCSEIGDAAIARIICAFGSSLRRLDVRRTYATVQALQKILSSAKRCGFKATEPLIHSLADHKQTGAVLALQQLKMQHAKFTFNANVFGVRMAQDLSLDPWSVPEFTKMAPHLTSLHLGGQNGYITDDFVDQLAHGLRNLRQINVFDCERLTDRTLLSLATYCPKLEAADISKSPHFSSIGVVELVRNCTGLKYLDISRIAVTDHVLAVVGNTLRELETLIMAECPRITSEGIVSAIEGSDGLGCQFTLQRLSFSNCPHVEKSMVDWCKQRLRQDAIVVW